MGGAISGITGAVSGILGGIGTNKALKQQQKATDKQMDYQRELAQQQAEWLSPFREAGAGALPQLTAIAGQPIDREQLLSDYYGGQEFAQSEEAARRSQLASAEATGGLGSTATSNSLAAIAPTLGQNYLNAMQAQQQDMYNQLLGLTNVGLTGAGAQSAAATGTTNALTALAGQKGQILGQKAALPWNTAASANSSLGYGAAQDVNSFSNMFGGMFGGMI
jgi:hypothetical protein